MSKTENKIKYEDVKDNFISYSYEEHPVKMDDVILVDRNAYIKDMTKEFIEELKYRQELLDYNIPQTRTLLFTGSPGLGKTYLAKAISTELKLPLYIVDVAETLGKNNGLEQMKKILQFCRDPDNQPCILFMDECDGLAASREDKSKSSSDKTGDNRITNYIMQCLQEENDSKTSKLIVIAATNFPEGLDVAFVNRFQLQFTYYLPDHYVPFIEMEMKKNKMFTLVKDVNDNEIEIIDINANKAGFSIRQLNAKILWAYKRAVIEKCKEGTLDGEPIPIKLSTILQQIAIEIQFGIDLNEIKNYEKQQEQDDFDKYVVNNKENNKGEVTI